MNGSVETAFARWIQKKQAGRGGQKHWSRDAIAERLGISRRQLDRLVAADRLPDLAMAFAIEDLTKGEVKARSWLRVERRPRDQ